MRQVALLAFDMRIFLQYLRGLRESGLLFMNRLHDNNSRIFRSQIQEKRTAVFHHGNKLLVSDPGRIKEDIITKMPDFIHDLTGIIYAAVIIAKLDNGCPERPVHHGTLGVSFRNQHAYILFIEARKSVIRHCKYLRPIVPPVVHGSKWEDGDTEDMANDISYFAFEPGGKWHSFQGYTKSQYFIDPMKLQLMTPGINMENGEYEDFGIPGIILADYLRDNDVIPEKCDLNDILFLMTPAETPTKLKDLIAKLVRFEKHIDQDSPMEKVIPSIYRKYEEKYRGYTIRRLCQEMHDFYKDRKINILQKRMFQKAYFPEYFMSPQQANWALVKGQGELIPLREVEGRVVLQAAVPYPPGVTCVQAGERWTRTALDYFLDFAEVANVFPGFEPELQGVYREKDPDGKITPYAYVLTREYEKLYK